MRRITLFCLLALYFTSCSKPKEIKVDICIYGGSSAGIIAAYSAIKQGKTVVVIEPTSHVGGLSTGGLGQTDIGNKYAVTGLAKDFYRRLGKIYNELESWTFEPHKAKQVFDDYIKEANITIIKNYQIKDLNKKNLLIESVLFQNSDTPSIKTDFLVRAKMFIDCSYEGDLMASAGVSYTIGREDNKQYNETLNGVQLMDLHQFPDSIDPYVKKGDASSGLLWGISAEKLLPNGTGDNKVQAYNFRICLTTDSSNLITITKPIDYDSSKFELLLRLIEKSGKKKLSNYLIISGMPNNKTDINNSGGFSTDMIGYNYDYANATWAKRKEIIQTHISYTQGLLYFLGHDSRVPDTLRLQMLKYGYPKDEYQEYNNFSPQLYIREARRMVGEYVMTENNCTGKIKVDDGVGLAAYTMDSHNCQRVVVNGMVKNEGNVEVGGFLPYPVSYRSLIPKKNECSNLLVPVCLSASHIAYGSIRMEPVFMVMAQSSSIAACMAIDNNIPLSEIDVVKLQNILKTNPLLDNSEPEIMIDNSDTSKIKTVGNWVKRTSGWVDKAYAGDFLFNDSTDKIKSVLFLPNIKKTGKYHVYYYCPSLVDYKALDNLPEKLKIIVKHQKGESIVFVNFRITESYWADLGVFDFDKDNNNSVTIDAKGLKGPAAADAVLFIPQL